MKLSRMIFLIGKLKHFFCISLVLIGLVCMHLPQLRLLVLDVHAQQTTIIGTVKINVCGDGVAEGPEECDGLDIQAATCPSFGFAEGVVTCDMACEYVTAGCVGVATSSATASPTPTPSPSSSSTVDTTQDLPLPSPSSSILTQVVAPVDNQFITRIPPNSSVDQQLTAKLALLGASANGTIPNVELKEVIQAWVNSWRGTSGVSQDPLVSGTPPAGVGQNINSQDTICDLNDDGICNLIDLSILLYYIEA